MRAVVVSAAALSLRCYDEHISGPLSWPQPLLIADKHDCLFSLAEASQQWVKLCLLFSSIAAANFLSFGSKYDARKSLKPPHTERRVTSP